MTRKTIRENLKFIRNDIDQFLNSDHSSYDIFQFLSEKLTVKIDCGQVFIDEARDGSFRIKDK